MIGSISKVRPCGVQHVYKYAHSKKIADAWASSCRRFNDDSNPNGEFHYTLPQLTSATNLFNDSIAEYFDIDFPEVKEASGVFSFRENKKLKYFRGRFPKCTYAHAFAYRCNGSVPRRDIILIMPEVTNITSAFSECSFGNGGLKIYAPKVTDASGIDSWMGATNVQSLVENSDFYMPNLEKATDMFATINYNEVYYWLNENGESVVGHGGTPTERKYFVFPKLKNGRGLFYRSTITSEYAKAICESLPDWTNDTDSHEITLGIHNNYKYDPDLQKSLLSIDNNYVPTMELDEYPATDKNWNLTVTWSGTPDINTIKPPIPEVDFAEIVLPEGYTRLKFLESKADYYYPRVIDTGVIITNKTGAYVDGDKSDNASNGERIFMGTSPSTSWATPRFAMFASPFGVYYNANGYRKDHTQQNSNIKLRVNYKNDRFVWFEDDNTKYYADNLQEITTENPYPIYLFGVNMGGTAASGYYVRIRRCIITEDQETIRDFIPCLDTDGVPCMYDLIGKMPYYDKNGRSYVYEVFDANEG